MSYVLDEIERPYEQISQPKLSKIWITRCPVPTATGIALKRGTLTQKFKEKKIDVFALQDLRQGLSIHHIDHQLPALFREGGNVPALAARSEGAPSRLIGLTWIDEWQVIIVRPDSEISKPEHLKGAKVALPAYADRRAASIFRAMSLHGIKGTLQIAGLSLQDVEFIEVKERGDSEKALDPSVFWTGLDALTTGEVDAVYVKGASAVEAAKKRGLKVGINLDEFPDLSTRVNNGTPRPITVHEDLLENHFDVVVDFLEELLDTADWAQNHLEEVLSILEGETIAEAESVATAYRNNFHLSLHPSLSEERLQLLRQQKDFLWLHGFLERDIDLDTWVDHRPLAEVLKRRQQKQNNI
ncbi:ABC transporter substrate-binding protein [Acinetobacter stercoris]|uniref:2'-hydroxybiphenyl-2-sulfinate desulfinase n=1 Tax=Acinetobacter stercoris TaxID=2126983 RepID=A0A2U3MXI4_9GAMM|nr:ABC transporter substrate-binding protein [Acinetobacter stercoris]SPL70147.1 2'-hydroxybiphenyl-2-sulfinate desulfinase [Acinetobacter stercoris]